MESAPPEPIKTTQPVLCHQLPGGCDPAWLTWHASRETERPLLGRLWAANNNDNNLVLRSQRQDLPFGLQYRPGQHRHRQTPMPEPPPPAWQALWATGRATASVFILTLLLAPGPAEVWRSREYSEAERPQEAVWVGELCWAILYPTAGHWV